MPVRRTINESQGIYFITFTCARWLKLFQLTNGYNVVYDWFNYLSSQGHFIIGYTVMPNHVHALIAFRNSGKNINIIVGNGKRFMAYGLVKRLQQGGFFSPQSLLRLRHSRGEGLCGKPNFCIFNQACRSEEQSTNLREFILSHSPVPAG